VCHAGEIGGPESVREAVEILGAERIGHGIAVMNDPALAESLITRRVVLENCPSSNLCTGALAKQTGKPDAKLKDHPLPKFLEQGLLVTLSTDDPALFHTDLLREYALTESLGLPRKRMLELAENSINAAFLPPMDKRELLENFRGAAKAAGLV
jgi:adenosine deaminase